MNKLFKKLYAVLGVLVMLLPIALSAVSGSVKAGEETKDTQTVVLTKLGFTKDQQEKFPGITNGAQLQNGEKYQAVSGIKFQIFDVTDAYLGLNSAEKLSLKNANEGLIVKHKDKRILGDNGKANTDSLIKADTTTVAEVPENEETKISFKKNLTEEEFKKTFFETNADGKISWELPNNHRYYVIREAKKGDRGLSEDYDADATYEVSKDLILSLPQVLKDEKGIALTDQTVYLYPKNFAAESMNLNFKVVDKYKAAQGLDGAIYTFSKTVSTGPAGDTKTYYAKKTENDIQWFEFDKNKAPNADVDDDKDFFFTSDSNGLINIVARPASNASALRSALSDVNKFGIADGMVISAHEVKAPDSYDELGDKPTSTFTFKVNLTGDKQGLFNVDENANSALKDAYDFTKGDVLSYSLSTKGNKEFLIGYEAQGLLPHTGGMGIVLFVLAGVTLIAVGAYAYKKQRA